MKREWRAEAKKAQVATDEDAVRLQGILLLGCDVGGEPGGETTIISKRKRKDDVVRMMMMLGVVRKTACEREERDER